MRVIAFIFYYLINFELIQDNVFHILFVKVDQETDDIAIGQYICKIYPQTIPWEYMAMSHKCGKIYSGRTCSYG